MKIIPREKRKHFGWSPELNSALAPIAQPTPQQNSMINITGYEFTLEQMLEGTTFEHSDLPTSLKQALEYATPEGIVLSMPELIAAKIKADTSHDFWQKWRSVHSEENIGIDKRGIYGEKDHAVLVVVHGGGILTPERIKKAYSDKLINGSAKYGIEFDNLLEGKLADDTQIRIYTLDEVKQGITIPTRRYGIVMPYTFAQPTTSGHLKKEDFIENPLVIARAGGMDNLEAYFDKAKMSGSTVGNWHAYDGKRDPTIPQGRVLFVDDDQVGLNGNVNLNFGRFVGVAPEAHGVAKK